MHRQPLITLLNEYEPVDVEQRRTRDRMLSFVAAHPECLQRELRVGHITSSAWIESADGSQALLTHHRKLKKWLQLGGHVDGEPDVLRSALREAREESGIESIEPVSHAVFDLDIHEIPAYGNTPAHLHYDVRFRLRVTDASPLVVSEESIALAWVTPEAFSTYATDESVARLFRKWSQVRKADCRSI